MLKTLQFGTFTHTQNAPVDHEEDTKHISSGSTLFGASFAGIALKLENTGSTFSSFDPCPPIPSLARGDRKQLQCLLIRQHDLAF